MDQTQLFSCMYIGMVVRSARLAGQGFQAAIVSPQPEADIGPAFVVFLARACDAICQSIFYKGSAILSMNDTKKAVISYYVTYEL